MTEERQKEILDALQAAGVSGVCPRCSHEEWTIFDNGTFNADLPFMESGTTPDMIISDDARLNLAHIHFPWPTVCLVCKKCGYISQHATKTLGIADPDNYVQVTRRQATIVTTTAQLYVAIDHAIANKGGK